MGEVAPTYFVSHQARERIAKTIPHAKVVCIFRDPVDRVVSLYRLKRAYGMIPWSFEEAITRDPELLESSKYGANLKAWLHTLGPDQVLALFGTEPVGTVVRGGRADIAWYDVLVEEWRASLPGVSRA